VSRHGIDRNRTIRAAPAASPLRPLDRAGPIASGHAGVHRRGGFEQEHMRLVVGDRPMIDPVGDD